MNTQSFQKALLLLFVPIALSLSSEARADALGDALNAPNLVWTTAGSAPWFAETTNTYDGVSAARSGTITNIGGSSQLQTTVTGRVEVVCWWQLATTNPGVAMYFNTNGSYVWERSGSNAWTPQTMSSDSGTNPVSLQWSVYMPWTDPTNWAGSAGYLDDVLVTNITGLKPVVLIPPPAAQLASDNYQAYTFIQALVIGDFPMSYQWQLNGTNLVEGYPFYNTTTPTLGVWDFTAAQNGDYQLVASNNWGMVTSAVCTVSVTNSPPYIASWYEPQDMMIAVGDCYSFSAYAGGTAPLYYQWLSNGVPVASANNFWYYFCPAMAAASGAYSVVVTNAYGALTSSVAQVTISTALPVITEQPNPEVAAAQPGDYVEFDAQGEGPQSIYYSWRKVGEDTDYFDWSYMYFDSVTSTNTGLYYVIVSNLNGSVTSRVSVLAVAPVDPLGVAIDAPGLSIANDLYSPWAPDVSGTNDYDGLCAAQSYPIWDYDSSSFAATNIMGPTNVSFWCRIDAAAQAYLDIIVDGNVSNTISGQTAWQQFSYSLPDGSHTITWTYRKDYAGIQDAGAAWVDQLVLSGSSGPPPPVSGFTSGGDATWFLESTYVHSPPNAWQSGPMSDTGSSWLQTTFTGPGMLSFWESASGNDASLLGYVVDGVSGNDLLGIAPWTQVTVPLGIGAHTITWTYYENVSGANDTGWVGDVVFTANSGPPPSITTQPTNVMVKAGNPAELDVSAIGDSLQYQWYVNSNSILNATNSSLIFSSAADSDNATYYAVVTNPGGSIQSSNATLTVVTPPTINYGPYYDTEFVGATAWFSVSVNGSDPLYYQWYKLTNTIWVPIASATNDFLEISNVTTNDAAWYHVVVSNWAGSCQSGPARLTVYVPPQIIAQSQNQTDYVGSVVLVWVEVTGTGPMNYYWYKDGKSIATTTVPYYSCVNAQTTNSGAYQVDVNGPNGGYAWTATPMNVFVQPVPTNASPGTVDRSFNFGLGASGASCVIPLTNGQMIIGGSFPSVDGIERHGLARLNADGSLDLSWDPQLSAGASVSAMLPQTNGGFLIGGSFTGVNGLGRTNVARLNADGSPDPSFNPGTGPNCPVTLMTATPDGGMIIYGWSLINVAGIARTNLAKLTSTGAVDTTFNAGTGPGSGYLIYSLASQGNAVLVGGYFTSFSGHAADSLVRLNSDGSFDSSFTPSGIKNGSANGDVYSLAVQPDGRILAAGTFGPVSTATNSGVVRLSTNGLYDATFTPPIGTSAGFYIVNVMKVLGNGQIVLGGNGLFGYPGTRVVRLNSNGSLDNGFATNGAVFDSDQFSLDVTADGHVVVAGTFLNVNGLLFHGIASLNSDGTLNPVFRPGLGSPAAVWAVAVQSDGKILIGGDFTNVDYVGRNGVARLLADGSLDSTFNPGTGASAGFDSDNPSSVYPYVRALAAYSNGCVLVGGVFTNFNGVAHTNLVRLLANGTVDATFSPPPLAAASPARSFVDAIAVQPDGKILIGGNFSSVAGAPAIGITRLLSNGSVDPSFNITLYYTGVTINALQVAPNGQIYAGGPLLWRFNADGSLDSSFSVSEYAAGGTIYSMVLQPDGKIVIGNDYSVYTQNLKRFNPDGTPDSTFYSGYGNGNTVTALALQPDGRLLVGGEFSSFNNYTRLSIARVNTDGSLDMLFNPTPYGYPNRCVYALAVLPDGRILAGGSIYAVSDRTMSSGVSLGRDNLMMLNAENPAIGALPVAPLILTSPQGGYVNVGASLTMNVVATGTPPFGYQWYENSQPIAGAVGSTLTLDPISLTNAGSYYVTVSNVVTTVPSGSATVYVYPPYVWSASGRTITLNWYGKPGHTYEVLQSTSGNLAHPGNPAWTVVGQVSPSNGNCSWYSPTLSSQTNGFFRVVDITTP